MLSWFLNPWMLLGGLAVASPILIHLLNKRRFKIVDWAAMDFLFAADKKNRRRVQLENFILLLLRCLAMLLLALMFARPFLPSSLTSALQQSQKFERVILIDDSLSQQVLVGALPAMDSVKKSAEELITRFANSDKSEDWLTVMLTSRPEQPLLANEPLTTNTLPTLTQAIQDIECSSASIDYSASLGELRRYVSGQRENISRVTYVFSDMRQRDWVDATESDSESAPNKIMNDVADASLGCFLIDTGSQQDDNLAIVDVRPETLQVAGKTLRYNVRVANYGTQTVNQVRVLLQIDDGQPDYEVIPSITPGAIEEVAFRYVYSPQVVEGSLLGDDTDSLPLFQNYRVRAEIDRQSLGEDGLVNDQLLEDSSAVFASRVIDGISVLLVDGDPSANSERSETHYLRSLDVIGTGLDVEIATVSDLETVSLSKYQVIYLCNVDEASPDRIKSLGQWVEDGGALVFMPGNRVRAATFNSAFYKDGAGLSPLSLVGIAGDPTMSKWVNFEIDPQIHPALETIVDSDASSLSNVDVFSWWTSELVAEQVGKTISVPLRLSDRDNSAAMVERASGKGKVVVFAIPGDGDWTMWPSSPTFAPVMIDLVDYLVGTEVDNASLQVGGSISYPIDLSVYDSRVGLRDPKNEKIETVAKPVSDEPSSEASILYNARFDKVDQRGFYNLELNRHTGETDTVLFASNLDPRESRLKRLPSSTLESDFFDDKVSLVSTEQLSTQTVSGGNTEIWMQLLMLLFGILVVEQFLGWFWGKRR
jgi:hypothetical protein